MQTIREVADLRRAVAALRADGGRVALVPTMGALHDGHMALVEAARARAPHVIASIFVNPLQFGASEDLSTYPRREAEDARMLEAAGCDILWAPTVEAMYPEGFATTITVAGASEGLCGAMRPGHFDGVATVVAKLFGQVTPDLALFGEKDFQQLVVIRRMTRDLDLPVEVQGVPTVREADGLALSSRNQYLSPEEWGIAHVFPQALSEAVTAIERGDAPAQALEQARQRILAAGFSGVDYVEYRGEATLEPLAAPDQPGRVIAAARLGRTRLIDNMPVRPRG